MAVLFCWHDQHKSDIGFIMVMDGTKDFHNLLKVEYPSDFTPSDSAESLYNFQMPLLQTLDGNNFMSVLLYPGIRPGRRMAFVAA